MKKKDSNNPNPNTSKSLNFVPFDVSCGPSYTMVLAQQQKGDMNLLEEYNTHKDLVDVEHQNLMKKIYKELTNSHKAD